MSQDTNPLEQKPQAAHYAAGLFILSLVCCWGRFCGDTTPKREAQPARVAQAPATGLPAAPALPLAGKPYGEALQTLQSDYDGRGMLGGSLSERTFNEATRACEQTPEGSRGECFGYMATILGGYADSFLSAGAHDKLDVMAGLVTLEVMETHPQLAGLSARFESSRQQRIAPLAAAMPSLVQDGTLEELRAASRALRQLDPSHDALAVASAALELRLKPTLSPKGRAVQAEGWEVKVLGAKTLKEYVNPKQGEVSARGETIYLDKRRVTPEQGDYFVIVELNAKNISNELEMVSHNGGALVGVTFALEADDGRSFNESLELGDYILRTPAYVFEVRTGRTEPFKLFFEAADVEKGRLYLLIKSDAGTERIKLF
jgi:hypothetical protein